jgi:hypothetical protein
MTTDNFCFYLQNRLIQTNQTGGQQYSDTSSFSIPWLKVHLNTEVIELVGDLISIENFISFQNETASGFKNNN